MELEELPGLDADEWRDLEVLEAEYLERSKDRLRKHSGICVECRFLGFAYRGIVTHGGREHTFQLGEATGDDQVRRVVERLIKVYLTVYGKAPTFNNLILETLWPSLAHSHSAGLSLHLGAQASAVKGHRDQFVEITLSSILLERLGLMDRIWSEIGKLADQDGPEESLFPICRTLLAPLRGKVGEAALYALHEESAFAWDLVSLVSDPLTTASQAIPVLETWLNAFQGLLLLRPIIGEHWLTVPVRADFGNRLPAHTRLPLSALTVAKSSAPADINHVRAAAKTLEHDEIAASLAEAITRRQASDDQKFRDSLKKVFPLGEECGVEWRHMRELPRLMKLSQKLVGKKHEGKPLSFTLLCAPDSHLLKLHRGSQQWTLTEIHSFPQLGADATVSGVAREMESNAFILQDPGRALFFRPHSLWPSAVVQFRPFDAQQSSEYLREFTTPPGESDPPALAIRTTPDTALLFAAGKLVAAFQRNEWAPVATDLQAPNGYIVLLQAIETLTWWKVLEANEQEICKPVLETIAKSVVEVSRKGYGGLFFLTKDWLPAEIRPKITTMAPVWARRRGIQHDDPGFVAAFAGLDGETYIELKSGLYLTRQFALVPSSIDSFLETFTSEGEKTPAFKEYLGKYDEFLTGEGLSDQQREERLEEVPQFGTRHMKALRITRAYPSSTIAITVSSNGPVRLWENGLPKVL